MAYSTWQEHELSDEALCKGSILFLKPESEINPDTLDRCDIGYGALNHPVLVLDKYKSYVHVCLLTSLGGADIVDHVHPNHYIWYLPIFPTPSIFVDRLQLHLLNGVTLRKSGYLKVRDSYWVHRSMLEPYDYDMPDDYYRLTTGSYNIVADIMGLERLKRTTIAVANGVDATSRSVQPAHSRSAPIRLNSRVYSRPRPPMTADVSAPIDARSKASHLRNEAPNNQNGLAKKIFITLYFSCAVLSGALILTILRCLLPLVGHNRPSSGMDLRHQCQQNHEI